MLMRKSVKTTLSTLLRCLTSLTAVITSLGSGGPLVCSNLCKDEGVIHKTWSYSLPNLPNTKYRVTVNYKTQWARKCHRPLVITLPAVGEEISEKKAKNKENGAMEHSILCQLQEICWFFVFFWWFLFFYFCVLCDDLANVGQRCWRIRWIDQVVCVIGESSYAIVFGTCPVGIIVEVTGHVIRDQSVHSK